MSNIIQFPSDASRITVEDILEQLTKAVEAGEVTHLLVVTMGPDTNVRTSMSTIPANMAVYMNHLQLMTIDRLIGEGGLVP